MDTKDAIKIIDAYDALVERAVQVVSDRPFLAAIDEEHGVTIEIEGDEVVLRWCEYEFDYYGGGHVENNATRFPSFALFMTDDELAAYRKKVNAEDDERNAKVQQAQFAVQKERQEAHEQAVLAQLINRYGVPK